MLSRFCSYELRTKDPAAAREFYAAVLGDAPPIGLLPERAAARGAPSHWLGHIGVADLAKSVEGCIAAGAEQLGPPQRTADGAELFVLRDPFGSVIALRPLAVGEPYVAWHQLHTHDQEKAFAFYSEQFGFAGVDAFIRNEERFIVFAWDSVSPPAGTIGNTAQIPGVHTHWAYFFDVPNLDEAIATAVARGGEVIDGPRNLPRGRRMAALHDPQGAELGLLETPPR